MVVAALRSHTRPSDTAIAVLALVIEQPSYGYEVFTRFERSYGPLLHVGKGAVYKALNHLHDIGLVEVSHDVGTRRQPKPKYKATRAGERLHREWLAADLLEDPRSAEIRLRLLSGPTDPHALAVIVEEYEARCLDAAVSLRPARRGATLRERMVVEYERMRLTRDADFLKRCREMIAEETG